MDNIEAIPQELDQFTGTEHYFKNFTGLVYTDGVRHLAERCGAYWFIDLVGSYQRQWKEKAYFQIWRLDVDLEKNKAVATMREDTDEAALVTQYIEFTDFPLTVFECYSIDGVMLLKSEY